MLLRVFTLLAITIAAKADLVTTITPLLQTAYTDIGRQVPNNLNQLVTAFVINIGQPVDCSRHAARFDQGVKLFSLGPYCVNEVKFNKRGANGNVHKGWDTVNNQYVAVKTAGGQPIGKDEITMNLLLKELGAAQHNIATFKQCGELDSKVWCVMDMLSKALDEVLSKDALSNLLTPSNKDRWSLQIIGAVNFLKNNGLVHWDIKPENIMLDAQNNAKLVDFGTAKAAASIRDNFGCAYLGRTGTPKFAAPEFRDFPGFATYGLPGKICDQAQRNNLPARMYAYDAFAVGLTLFELATKKNLYDTNGKWVKEEKVDVTNSDGTKTFKLQPVLSQAYQGNWLAQFQMEDKYRRTVQCLLNLNAVQRCNICRGNAFFRNTDDSHC